MDFGLVQFSMGCIYCAERTKIECGGEKKNQWNHLHFLHYPHFQYSKVQKMQKVQRYRHIFH